jgi:hypothetical protein
MLFNPNWNGPSVAGLASYLETRDPAETYIYMNCQMCLLHEYGEAIGVEYGHPHAFGPVLETIALKFPHTYGAALERARAAQLTEI